MESLLIINNDNQKVSTWILEYLKEKFQTSVAMNHTEGKAMIQNHFYDLFLVVTNEINQFLIDIFNDIRTDNRNLLPVIICVPEITDSIKVQAFELRALNLIDYPIDLNQLEYELASVLDILPVTNNKTIELSTRKHDYTYLAKKIIYIERTRAKYIKVVYQDDDRISEEEYFFRPSLEIFLTRFGLQRYLLHVHQRHLVNPRFVRNYDRNDLVVNLSTGGTIPLGMVLYKKLKGGEGRD